MTFLLPPDGGPSEDFSIDDGEGGPSGAEVNREVSDAFKAQIKSDQAALKAMFKQESKTRQKDTKLAGSIAKFLQDSRYEHWAFLVAQLVATNTATYFISSILALVDEESKQSMLDKLEEEGIKPAAKGSYEVDLGSTTALVQSINEQTEGEIDEWIYHMYQIGMIAPDKVLASVITKEGEIFLPLTQLSTFVLQEFLRKKSIDASFEETNQLVLLFITKVLTSLKYAADKRVEQLNETNLEEMPPTQDN